MDVTEVAHITSMSQSTVGRPARDLVVVGSANLDQVIAVARPPQRGETVAGGDAIEGPGGKGFNQAVAAARLGLPVGMVGAVGEDSAAELLRETLAREGVADWLASVAQPTGRAIVLVDEDGDSTITLSPGANAAVDAGAVDHRAAEISAARAVLLQHEVGAEALVAASEHCRGLLVLNPAPARPVPEEVMARVDVLVPNAAELAALVGSDAVPKDLAGVVALVGDLRTAADVVVTLGANGAIVVPSEAEPVAVPARRVQVVDATAAGDTFCAALVEALLSGRDLAAATGYATQVAALTVSRRGAALSVPRRDEVDAWISG